MTNIETADNQSEGIQLVEDGKKDDEGNEGGRILDTWKGIGFQWWSVDSSVK